MCIKQHKCHFCDVAFSVEFTEQDLADTGKLVNCAHCGQEIFVPTGEDLAILPVHFRGPDLLWPFEYADGP